MLSYRFLDSEHDLVDILTKNKEGGDISWVKNPFFQHQKFKNRELSKISSTFCSA
jgi:hypothetical protein